MTNEEKTKELADFLYFKLSHIDYGTLTEKLLEMAEWKDEQFSIERKQLIGKANQAVTQSFKNGVIKKREMIEKACEWLELHMQCGVHPQNVASTIKQFRKAMEE